MVKYQFWPIEIQLDLNRGVEQCLGVSLTGRFPPKE